MEILVVDVVNTYNRIDKAAVISLDSGLVEQQRHLFDVRDGFCQSAYALSG